MDFYSLEIHFLFSEMVHGTERCGTEAVSLHRTIMVCETCMQHDFNEVTSILYGRCSSKTIFGGLKKNFV